MPSLRLLMTMKQPNNTSPIKIKIAFFNVGQGDTIVISSPDTHEAIVVDCVNEKIVLEYLKQEQIQHLRGIIITHLHKDHYEKVIKLIDGLQVYGLNECEILGTSRFYNQTSNQRQQIHELRRLQDDHSAEQGNDKRVTRKLYQNLLEWIERNKEKIKLFQEDNRPFPLNGELAKSIKVVHPHIADMPYLETFGQDNTTVNNMSVCLHVQSSGASALLTGDLEPYGWQKLLENHPNLQADVLKFPHHGGAWELTDAESLLNQLSPSMVVISVGCATDLGKHKDKSNKHGHPNESVFESLKNWAIKHQTFQLLCTQATSLCHPGLFEESTRLSIRDAIAKELGVFAQYSVPVKNSCPCAGTVIVELGQTAQLIQPKKAVHHQVIKTYFNKHQCNLSY